VLVLNQWRCHIHQLKNDFALLIAYNFMDVACKLRVLCVTTDLNHSDLGDILAARR
jgi:hypothetical protein